MGVAPVRRYPFPVREWARTIWVSAAARDLWQPRLAAIAQAWEAVERSSVGPVRLAARQAIAPEQFPEFSRKAAAMGLTAVALSQEGRHGSYQAGPAALTPGGRWNYQVALAATPTAARAFVAAWTASQDDIIGDLLGFPPCCVAFFKKTWVDEKWIDTTWPMALNTAQAHVDTSQFSGNGADVTIDLPPVRGASFATCPTEANILLRWIGVRWVPHLPCSFQCAATAAMGAQMRALMAESFPQEAAWVDELLDSPVEWSAWRGIAEIKTPILKISAKTDATVEKLVVRFNSDRYPEGGATGNSFPYRALKTAVTVSPLRLFRSSEITEPVTPAMDAPPARARLTHIDVHLDGCCDGNGPVIRTESLVDNSAHGERRVSMDELRQHHHDGHCHPCGVLCAPQVCGPGTHYDPNSWKDNGFADFESMWAAHRVLVSFYFHHVCADGFLRPVAQRPLVVDLGAGNGSLVRQLSSNGLGIESDPDRAARGALNTTMRCLSIEQFVASSEAEISVDTVLLMPGRLVEMPAPAAAQVRRWVKAHATRVLVYAYGDWLTRYPLGLLGLCEAAGLALQPAPQSAAAGVQVGLLDMEAAW